MGETTEMFFISYASDDRSRVRPIWKRLQNDFPGVKFWFDEQDLPVGADWNLTIQQAKDQAAGMLLFLSATSVGKEGYIQREFKWAMDRMEEMPEGHTFLYPVKLEPCALPYQMQKWQACDLFGDDTGYQRLKMALQSRLGQFRVQTGGEQPPPAARQIAFIVTEEFPLKILERIYRDCTSNNLQQRTGPLPTFDLELAHGAARILLVEHRNAEFTSLEQQLYLFRPHQIVILGLGMTQAASYKDTGRLVVPSRIHGYRVQAVTQYGVRDFELIPDASPYIPSLPLGDPSLTPDTQHKVGVISTEMDLFLLRRQIADSDLDIVELENGSLFPVVAGYTRDWMLLSAIAGSFRPSTTGRESAAYAVAKKVMQMLGF